MSAQQFMEMLFGKLPEFFKDEAELRALWSAPDTREKLLQGLAEKGFGARAAGRDAEDHRRREERPLRRAGPRRLRPAAAHPRGAGRQSQGGRSARTSTASSRPSSTSCSSHYVKRRRGGTRPGEAHAAAQAQVPQLHCRRRGRPRQARRDRQSLRGLPEVSVSTIDPKGVVSNCIA